MKIVDVIPIHKGVFRDHLTYFTAQEIEPGALVTIPVKNKNVLALVAEARPAGEAKAELRSADFPIKKLGTVKGGGHLLPEFLAAARTASNYFASPLPLVMKSLLPQIILENLGNLKQSPANLSSEETKFEKQSLQEPDGERLSFYKSLIREAFARKTSVFFCLPTVTDIEIASDLLSRGIEEYVVVLHNKLPKAKILELWQKALNSDHPILILATPSFLSLPRSDIKTIIVDKENSSAYKTLTRPFLDWRLFATFLARELKIKVIWGDVALRSETIYWTESGEFQPASPLKYRTYSEAKQEMINLKNSNPEESRRDFEVLSDRLIEQIDLLTADNERFFLLASRRGLAPTTICSDCGTVLSCDICSSPLVLHKDLSREDKNVFICHKCGQLVEIDDKCPVCGGWRLAVLGYGIEKVEEKLRESIPRLKILRIDSDTVKTEKRAKEICEEFLNSPGSVLIGTEMALFYLKEKVENTAIATIDSLFALPDFRISEKVLNLVLRLKTLAIKRFFIQTRRPEERVFNYITKGALADFYRDEIVDRKRSSYPPFSLLIKITKEGKKEEVKKEMKWLSEELANYEPLIYPAFTSKVKGSYVMHALIKTEPKRWPDPRLVPLLKSLPPSFIINVDPDSVL